MTTTQSDKAVLTKYPIAPSKCVVCLRSSDGQLEFIDFQMNLDIYGSVNICVDCMKNVMDLIDSEHLRDVEQQNINLVEMNRELVAKNEQLNATLDSLFNLRPDLKPSNLSVDAEPVEDSTDYFGQDELGFSI